jgi:hypothetical protein
MGCGCVGNLPQQSRIASFSPNPLGGGGRVARNMNGIGPIGRGYSPNTTFNGRQVVPRNGANGARTASPNSITAQGNNGGIFGGLLGNIFNALGGSNGGIGGMLQSIFGGIGNLFSGNGGGGGLTGLLGSFLQGGISGVLQNIIGGLFNGGNQQQNGSGGLFGGGGSGILGGIMQLFSGLFR